MAKVWPSTTGFHVDIQTPKIKIRDELGHYTSAQAELYRSAREQMIIQQGQVALRIKNNILRKSVTTGRLVRVTADTKNVVSERTSEDQFTVGLGNEEFLNKSMAKYWRTIEEGSAVTWTKRPFTSLPLQGFWGHSLGPYRTGPSGPWVSVNTPYSKAGGGMYTPFRIGRGGKPSGLPIYNPGHDIRPMHAYKGVAEDKNFLRNNLLFFDRFIRKVTSLGSIHNPPDENGSPFYAGY